MRKFMILVCGILTVGLLAACTPTKVAREDQPETVFSPETTAAEPIDRTPDPNQPSMAMFFVFRVSPDGSGLERLENSADTMDAEVLMDKLIEYGVVDEETQIVSFDVEGDTAFGPGSPDGVAGGERIGYLDLSKVPSSAAADEEMTLKAIGNTYMENFELDKLKLLINGANYDSGNIVQGDEDYLEYEEKYVDVKDDAGNNAETEEADDKADESEEG